MYCYFKKPYLTKISYHDRLNTLFQKYLVLFLPKKSFILEVIKDVSDERLRYRKYLYYFKKIIKKPTRFKKPKFGV